MNKIKSNKSKKKQESINNEDEEVLETAKRITEELEKLEKKKILNKNFLNDIDTLVIQPKILNQQHQQQIQLPQSAQPAQSTLLKFKSHAKSKNNWDNKINKRKKDEPIQPTPLKLSKKSKKSADQIINEIKKVYED